MNRFLKTVALLATSSLVFTALHAQQVPSGTGYERMQLPHEFNRLNPMMPFAGFPTREELDRLTPPEPLTEEKIRQRFAQRRASLIKALEQDRKAAEEYANDFALYQKYQAQSLLKMMAEAEQHRQRMLQDLEAQEQQALQQFKQQESSSESAPATEKKN